MWWNKPKASTVNAANVKKDGNNRDNIVLDQEVRDQIDKLSKYIEYFNTSDLNSLFKVIDESGNNYGDLKAVKAFVKEFYENLMKQISEENSNLSNSQKNDKLQAHLQDQKLPEYIKTIYDKELNKLKEDVSNSTYIQNDSGAKKNLETIFTNISHLKSKYKYFEYKYIQLNLFMLVFIQHTFKTMEDFVSKVTKYIAEQDKTRSKTVSELINLLVKIMNQADLNIDKNDFNAINIMMASLEKEIKDKQNRVNSQVSKFATEASAQLLQGLSGNNSSNPFTSIAPAPTTPPTNGGFVRSHSRFPQAFFDLNA